MVRVQSVLRGARRLKIVRDRLDARWLPSRFRFAIFRLIAYVVFRLTRQKEERGIVVVIDRDQSAIENYSVAAVVMLVVTSFAYAALTRFLVRPAAIVLAPFAASAILQWFTIWSLLTTQYRRYE